MSVDIERAEEIEEATVEVCKAQEAAERAAGKVYDIKADLADAREAAKEAEESLRTSARRLRMLRDGRFPDPEKFPLLDKHDGGETDDE